MNFESSHWIYQNIKMRGGRKTERQTHTHIEGDKDGGEWGGERERMNYFSFFFLDLWECLQTRNMMLG